MTPFAPSRARRLAAAASALTVIAVAVGVLVWALGASLPEMWWPRTGHAFAARPQFAQQDPCALIVGPAKAYCERGRHAASTGSNQHGGDAATWKLLPATTAVGALVVWRRRTSTRQGRA
ncbi:hypothetical protein [Streptomyces sp. AC555_RSS877]|uniref:hypothetical protein n=1 Tax=Streptomyces sp. AC555_RSS877 TaxID=2823688 RepID=UPI001C258FB6|nr:hypothetical protein [Streptomyces sp. AC555_RSS877]